jgi:hypothetical protein
MLAEPCHEGRMTSDFKVTEILSDGIEGEAVASQIELDRMVLKQAGPVEWRSRYAWLLVHLPGRLSPMRILAERVDTQDGDEVQVRFKHLFPEHRRILEQLLAPAA